MGLPQIVLVGSSTRPNTFRRAYERLTWHGGISRLFDAGVIAKPWLYFCKQIDESAPSYLDTRVWDVTLARKARPFLNLFYAMLYRADPHSDFIFFEDDIAPCKNAVERAVLEPVPLWAGVMTFFDGRNEWPRPGIFPHPTDRPLYGSQAMKFPARHMPAIKDFVTKRTIPLWEGTDGWAGLAAVKLGLTVAQYSPTIFQHLGMISAYAPGRVPFIADNYPGEDFDAMGDCSDPVLRGSWQGVTESTWCKLHRMHHRIEDYGRCQFARDTE